VAQRHGRTRLQRSDGLLRVVAGAVISDNDFEVLIVLGEASLDDASQGIRTVIGGDDDGNSGRWHIGNCAHEGQSRRTA
jgi:hypothetical protein